MPYLLLFAAGVTLAQCCLAPPSWMAALACAVLLGCGPWRRHGVWLLALIVGFAWSAWRIEQRLASAWPAQWEGRPVMVTLRVVGLPRQDAMATRLDAVLEHVELSPPLANWPARVGVSDYQRGDWPAGTPPPTRPVWPPCGTMLARCAAHLPGPQPGWAAVRLARSA